MPVRLNEKRQFQRFVHTEDETSELKSKGFTTVNSSNVSAIAKNKADLIIRFHGGATYSYSGKGNQFTTMLASASKGKWVWRFLIRPNVSYQKIGNVEIKDDVPSRDMMVEKDKPKARNDISTIIPIESSSLLDTMILSNFAKDLGTIASLLVASNINGTSLN